MRAFVRAFVACVLLVAPLGLTASAAPLLTGGNITFSESPHSDIGPLAFVVGSGHEFCGANGGACNGSALTTPVAILLDDDFIDFAGTSVTFDLAGGGAPLAGYPGYLDLLLDPTATFTMSNLIFSNGGVLAGFSSVSLADVVLVDQPTFTSDSLTFIVGTLGVDESAGRGRIVFNLDIRTTQPPDPDPDPVPEPSSLLLLGTALVASARTLRRRASR